MKSALTLRMTNLSTNSSPSLLGEITLLGEGDDPQDNESVYQEVGDPAFVLPVALHRVDPTVADPEVSLSVAGHSASNVDKRPACTTVVPLLDAQKDHSVEASTLPASSIIPGCSQARA